jgi:hypothetical protein
MNYTYHKLGLLIVLVLLFACKKKSDPNTNTNIAPLFCSLADETSSVNDTIKQIMSDTSYSTGNNTFYTQHLISEDEGISLDFEGSEKPVAGDYIITPAFIEVKPGSKKCYLQYFVNGESFVAQAGKVEVGSSGSLYFCKINFKNTFGIQYTISIKTNIK